MELDPVEQLARQRATTRRRTLIVLGLAASAVGAVVLWSLPKEVPPEQQLFARDIPRWGVEKINGRPADTQRETMLSRAEPWPQLRARLAELDAAFADRTAFKAAVAAVNAATKEAGLAFWLDAPVTSGKQWLLTYEVLARPRWTYGSGGREVEVLRVRRLDRVNLVMAFLGHAGGDSPVVLVDRVEDELIDLVRRSHETDGEPGEVEEAARGAWRSAMNEVVDPAALAEAARLLEVRRKAHERVETAMKRGVDVDAPDRIELGDEFFDSLRPYTDVSRPGGPLILGPTLTAFRDADVALRSGPARETLEKALDVMVLGTEAHEARHVFEPSKENAAVAEAVLATAGDDDLGFARVSQGELVAYFAQLHASERPCTVLAQLAFRAGGDRARTTPHHYASRLILRLLSSEPDQPLTRARLAGDLIELCRVPPAQMRSKVEAAWLKVFDTPFVPASRSF